VPQNKGMKLTKLSAAPLLERRCRLMPAPPRLDAGTASQLIPGVLRTVGVSTRLTNRRDSAEGSGVGSGVDSASQLLEAGLHVE
jgi:hypothetical protein